VSAQQNRLRPEDRAAHDWYRFVLSFPPHLVREYLKRFGVDGNQRVLDPFCGTGTTLVECRKLGIASIGVEANPMASFAARVKLDWSADPDRLIEHAHAVARGVARDVVTGEALRTLPPEQSKLLLRGSISPLPLHKTLVLLDRLKRQHDDRCEQHELLALARALVTSIGNLRFAPEVSVTAAKADVPVLESWLACVSAIAGDLRQLPARDDTPAQVLSGDARQLLTVLEPCSIDAVITSPPYPNEKDYTRTTRLESVLLGLLHDKAELRVQKRALLRSNTRGVYAGDDDDRWIATHAEIQRIASKIEAKRIELGKTSGFERLYARVTRLYFGGMARHLADLRTILRPGAQLAYVVGDQASYLRIPIPTGRLLGEIAQSLGYERIGSELFRIRAATATRAQLREEVVLLRWPGASMPGDD
jgi:hypothetical protein